MLLLCCSFRRRALTDVRGCCLCCLCFQCCQCREGSVLSVCSVEERRKSRQFASRATCRYDHVMTEPLDVMSSFPLAAQPRHLLCAVLDSGQRPTNAEGSHVQAAMKRQYGLPSGSLPPFLGCPSALVRATRLKRGTKDKSKKNNNNNSGVKGSIFATIEKQHFSSTLY